MKLIDGHFFWISINDDRIFNHSKEIIKFVKKNYSRGAKIRFRRRDGRLYIIGNTWQICNAVYGIALKFKELGFEKTF